MQDTQSHIERLVERSPGNFNMGTAIPQKAIFVIPERVRIPQTSAAKVDVTSTGLSPNGSIILDAYVRVFDRLFVPYNGPDEPPTFEPEDYPVR